MQDDEDNDDADIDEKKDGNGSDAENNVGFDDDSYTDNNTNNADADEDNDCKLWLILSVTPHLTLTVAMVVSLPMAMIMATILTKTQMATLPANHEMRNRRADRKTRGNKNTFFKRRTELDVITTSHPDSQVAISHRRARASNITTHTVVRIVLGEPGSSPIRYFGTQTSL